MNDFFVKLFAYLEMDFVWYAIIVGVLIALCSSLLGVTLVLRRFSMIGDGLSHVAFGSATVAAVCGLTNETFVVLPVTVISMSSRNAYRAADKNPPSSAPSA